MFTEPGAVELVSGLVADRPAETRLVAERQDRGGLPGSGRVLAAVAAGSGRR